MLFPKLYQTGGWNGEKQFAAKRRIRLAARKAFNRNQIATEEKMNREQIATGKKVNCKQTAVRWTLNFGQIVAPAESQLVN